MTPTPVPASSAPAFDESNLVARAQAGEQAAFAALVAEYSRKIYRVAKNITQNDEDAEDVLQETFLKAYEHLLRLPGQFQVLHLDRAHRRERIADEAAQAQGQPLRVARRTHRNRRRRGETGDRGLGGQPRAALFAGGNADES